MPTSYAIFQQILRRGHCSLAFIATRRLRHGPRLHAGALRPRRVVGCHLLHALRLLIGKVMHFRAITLHVIELPRIRKSRNQLPLPCPHRAVALVLPEEGTLSERLAFEGWQKARAFERQRRSSGFAYIRIRNACSLKAGRHDVDLMADRMCDAFVLQAAWPMDDERRRDTALMRVVLVKPERRVARIAPRNTVARVGGR